MYQNRRNFVKLGSLAALSITGPARLAANILHGAKPTTHPFGIQVYTLKEDMVLDAKGTLQQLSTFGYKQIESFEGKQGMFWGMTNKEFKKLMDGLGMKIVSSHCDITKDFEKKAAQAAEIGMKYLICPWKGPQKSIDDFKRFAEEFNKCGDICAKNGIRFAYHNHDYSFKPLENQLPQEVMLQNTNPVTVDFELDIYWIVTAGMNVDEHLKKYKNRYKLCHIKDRMAVPLPNNQNSSCKLGTGSIPFASVLNTAKNNGMQYFFVEQEYFENTTPLESSKSNAAYMQRLKF